MIDRRARLDTSSLPSRMEGSEPVYRRHRLCLPVTQEGRCGASLHVSVRQESLAQGCGRGWRENPERIPLRTSQPASQPQQLAGEFRHGCEDCADDASTLKVANDARPVYSRRQRQQNHCTGQVLWIDCGSGRCTKNAASDTVVRSGDVVQLVRTLPCHGRGRGFESRRPRHSFQALATLASGKSGDVRGR